jgi:hypothetical protein
MKKALSDILSDIFQNLKTYVVSKIDLYLLTTFERIGKVFSFILSSIILILISFFCLFFLSIALAIWLGNILDNPTVGYLIIAGGYFLLGVIFIIFRKALIDRPIIKELLKALFNSEKNK